MAKKKLPISVFIIAKNEADRISKPILSTIDWADEVIVIDSGSDDDTVSVAKKLGARVIFNEWPGYGPQKCFGEQQCRNNWLLNLDADEEVTQQLAEQIQELFYAKGPEHAAYYMGLKTLFQFEETPPPFAISKQVLRLYDKTKAGFKDSIVHDEVVVHQGSIGKLKGILHHRCFRDLAHWDNKLNFYSSLQAQDYIARGRKPSVLRLIFEPSFAFLKSYFLRGYVFYGVDGIVASFMYAHGRMLRMAKIRELAKQQAYEAKHGK